MRLVLMAGIIMLTGCPQAAKPPPSSEPNSPSYLDGLEQQYESFRGPLALHSWQEAVGEPSSDPSDWRTAREEFYADSSIDEELALIAAGDDLEQAERALGWIRARGNDSMLMDEEVEAASAALQQAMAGTPGSELYGQAALMVLYGSENPEERDLAMLEVANRTAGALPFLAARSAALNRAAQEQGFEDYVSAHTGRPVSEERPRVAAQCASAIEQGADGWELLLARGEELLGRPATDADWLALSTSWSGEAGSFLPSEDLPNLSAEAFGQMGFDIGAMDIEIRITPDRPGGAAYPISIPDDVRFRGYFPSGFEGARGWFHELGHAVHMKEIRQTQLPFKALPYERSLSEGIGEIFASLLRDPQWVEEEFPGVSNDARENYLAATEAFDAYAVRTYCYLTRLELALFEGEADETELVAIHEETFGTEPQHGPAYGLYVYLSRPLYVWDYLMSQEVTQTFLSRLGATPLRSVEAGEQLRSSLLGPGAQLTLNGYLSGEEAQ